MARLIKRSRGSVLVLTAISMVVLLGFAALAIDVGAMYAAKNQLQAAVDSAALAGASGLLVSDDVARSRAFQFARTNTCLTRPVDAPYAEVTVNLVTGQSVEVIAIRRVDLFFARVLGIPDANIRARAVARLDGLNTVSKGLRPWAIPDSDYTVGDIVLLKSGANGPAYANSSFFYPVCFPPLGPDPDNFLHNQIKGADIYKTLIQTGYNGPVSVGDWLLVETGGMQSDIKPTESIIGQVVTVAMFDKSNVPPSGRSEVLVTRFGEFELIEVVQHKDDDRGVNKGDIYGSFIREVASGDPGSGSTSLAVGPHLVE